jgi:hypothetical protein
MALPVVRLLGEYRYAGADKIEALLR